MILILHQTGGSDHICELLSSLKKHAYTEHKIERETPTLPDVAQQPGLLLLQTEKADKKAFDLIAAARKKYGALPYLLVTNSQPQLAQLKKAEEDNGVCYAIENLSAATLSFTIKHLQATQEQSTDYYALFADSPLPMVMYDKESMQVLDANQATIEKYGYTLREMQQLSIADLRPKEDARRFKNAYKKHSHDRYHDFGVWRHKKKNGEVFYVHIFSQNVMVNGQPMHIAIALDVDEATKALKEKKELTTELENYQTRVEEILDYVNEAIWIRDAKTLKLTYINKACEYIYGYKADELIGTMGNLETMPNQQDRRNMELQIKKVRKEGNADLEYRILDKKGREKIVISKAVYKKGKRGAPDTIHGVTIDVTELKATLKELKEKSVELDRILDSITDGFFRIDRDYRFTYVNKTFEDKFNLRKQIILGKSYWEHFPKAKEGRFYEEYEKAFEEQKPSHFEEYATSTGRWVSVNVYPDSEGLSVYFTDISEEHELRERIKRSELNMRSIINNTADLIWAVDADLNLIYANDKFVTRIHNFAGIKPKPGDHVLFSFMPANELKNYRNAYARALNGEQVTTIEEHDSMDRKKIYLETSYYPMEEEDGTISGVSCYMRDVTERRRHINNIEKANRQLQEIAWIQSHKVRSHTATIMGLVNLLKEYDNIPDDNKKALEGIKASAQELDLVIREIDKKTKMK